MVGRFDDNPTIASRALQIWLILIGKAMNRQTITYTQLSELIDYSSPRSIGKKLDPIFHYCEQNNLPPLTILVVQKGTGIPGSGIGDFSYTDQEAVFEFDWYSIFPPTVEELETLY